MLYLTEDIMLYTYGPSNAYLRIQSKIPEDLKLKNFSLVVIHYTTDEFECNRWTTRTRDIVKKHAKMLQFDVCHGYLMEPTRFMQFINNLNNKDKNSTFPFLAYRLTGEKWISTVDVFSFNNVNFIECYNYRGSDSWII